MGKAIAERFLEGGAEVMITGRTEAKLKKTVEETMRNKLDRKDDVYIMSIQYFPEITTISRLTKQQSRRDLFLGTYLLEQFL